MLEWSDIRIFLAVARAGSTLGAAGRLCLNQTTVSRRVQALEHALGLVLFERDTRGYRPTPHGKALLDLAISMEDVAGDFHQRAQTLRRDQGGRIKVTAAGSVFNYFVAPLIAKYRRLHPEIQFEAAESDHQLDLEKGEADIAFPPPTGYRATNLIARRLTLSAWGIYCSWAYMAERGMPRSIAELSGHPVVSFAPSIVQAIAGQRWFMDQVDPADVVSTVNSVQYMSGALRAGIGVGTIPCIEGDPFADLVCCFVEPEMAHDIWLVASRDAYSQPRIRAFMKFAADNIRHDPRVGATPARAPG